MYIASRKACEILGIHANTLRNWAKNGKIKHIVTEAGQRRYDIKSYLGEASKCETICYCRVSSYKQKDDLDRQVEFMQEKYPSAEIVKDIGSGINFKRKGLKALLNGEIMLICSSKDIKLLVYKYILEEISKWISAAKPN